MEKQCIFACNWNMKWAFLVEAGFARIVNCTPAGTLALPGRPRVRPYGARVAIGMTSTPSLRWYARSPFPTRTARNSGAFT